MGEVEFNKMYHTAIKKIAVGFYILDTCGDQLGYDWILAATSWAMTPIPCLQTNTSCVLSLPMAFLCQKLTYTTMLVVYVYL